MKKSILLAVVVSCSACYQFEQSRQSCPKVVVETQLKQVLQINQTTIRHPPNARAVWNNLVKGILWCYTQPKYLPATSEPSSEPVEVASVADLPPGAQVATWIHRKGFTVYYVVKADGSGYDYYEVPL